MSRRCGRRAKISNITGTWPIRTERGMLPCPARQCRQRVAGGPTPNSACGFCWKLWWLPMRYSTFRESRAMTFIAGAPGRLAAAPARLQRVLRPRRTDGPRPLHHHDPLATLLRSGRAGLRFLLAGREGSLLGLVHFLCHRSTTRIELAWYLQDLFTAPGSRGQGVGRTLIEAAYPAARLAGIRRIYWQTHETNAASTPGVRHLRQTPWLHSPRARCLTAWPMRR